jgi:hypothetical protein
MREEKFLDRLSRTFGDAVADVREKFEEAVWGRAVTDREATAPQWPQARDEPEPSFGSVTRTIDVGPTRDQMQENGNYRLAAMERELNRPQWPKENGPTQDIGQDRDRNADRDMDR